MLLNELKTLFRRRRTIASLVALGAVPVLISFAVKLSHSHAHDGEGPVFVDQITRNGFFAALTALAVVSTFLLPLMVSIVAGDSIAGEANLGSLRYVLIRPVSRTRLLILKYIAIVAYALVASLVVVTMGIIAGGLFFGLHDVVTLSGNQISLGDGFLRAVFAALTVTGGMAALGAVGLFVSTLTEQPVGAMVTTIAIAVVSEIIDSVPQLHAVHGALLTHYWQAFVDVFRSPVSFTNVEHGLILHIIWIAVFGTAAWARFTTKDVLA